MVGLYFLFLMQFSVPQQFNCARLVIESLFSMERICVNKKEKDLCTLK